MFHLEGIDLVSRLIDGQFPNYQQVLPKAHTTRSVIDREDLLKAVRLGRPDRQRGGEHRQARRSASTGSRASTSPRPPRSATTRAGSRRPSRATARRSRSTPATWSTSSRTSTPTSSRSSSTDRSRPGCSGRSATTPTPTSSCPSGRRPRGGRVRRPGYRSARVDPASATCAATRSSTPTSDRVRSSSGARTPPARRACSRRSCCWPGAARIARAPTPSSSAGVPTSRASRARRPIGPVRAPTRRVEVALVRDGAGGQRKRIRVNGVAAPGDRAVGGSSGSVMFAPEDMLLVAGSPGPAAGRDRHAGRQPLAGLGADLATYGRALQQRNGLLRAIREGEAAPRRAALLGRRPCSSPAAPSSRAVWQRSRRSPSRSAGRTPRSPRTRARLTLRYETNAPRATGRDVRDALARRLAETAEKEVWNGDDARRPAPRRPRVRARRAATWPAFASRGQQRTAILALKLAELELLTALDGRPPLLLLDDVFSELDPERRAHLVRRIAELPQAFVTTTTLDDLDPALRAAATSWAVEAGPDGATLVGPRRPWPARMTSRRAADGADRRLAPGCGPRARPRRRASPGPGDRDLGCTRRRARAGRDRRLPPGRIEADALWSRRMRRSSPRSCDSAHGRAPGSLPDGPRGLLCHRASGPSPARIIRQTCQPPRGRETRSRVLDQAGRDAPGPSSPPDRRRGPHLAVRLQMKLGFVAERTASPTRRIRSSPKSRRSARSCGRRATSTCS